MEDKEFIPNGEYEFTSAIGGGSIDIEGYYKDNPSEGASVTIFYNYEKGEYRGGGFAYGDVV
ncbi:hypothetical protein D1953_18100 [Peribacillus asahii]|uniref:Uncharacterized protein n=1 Tax=Peribacillus asahii TaxID=228899 RepID=A0A398AXP1_9BACI|nr:hypothetical protein [Peribacillus asahii]RID82397.1 hypothetical protein D1953_18100 [Peribacillus asahii]